MGLRIVVMGVSGSGKTTVWQRLAQALGQPYVEGDELHPPQNVQRMAAGIALTDEDRQGWLQRIAEHLAGAAQQRGGVVISCSALKRSYRDLLRAAAPDVRFVHLHGDADLLAQRLQERQGHYMPASLLQSQLQTLEMPTDDERPVRLDIAQALSAQLATALAALEQP